TCFCRPILMALLFRPPFARAYESRKMSRRGKLAHRRRQKRGLFRAALMPSRGWPSLAAEVFSLNDKAVDATALIVGERPMAALRSGRDVSAARPSRSEFLAPRPARAACRKAATTNVDLGLKAAGNGPASALTGLGSCRPMHFSPPAGTERAPRRPLTPDGALIPVGVDPGQDGAPEGIEFPGAGAPCAPQFRFDPFDCVGGAEAGDEFGDRAAEGALQQAFFSRMKEGAIDLGHGALHTRKGMSTLAYAPGAAGLRRFRRRAGVQKETSQRRARASGGIRLNGSGGGGRRPVVVVVFDRMVLEGEAFVEFGERDLEADFRHGEDVVVFQDKGAPPVLGADENGRSDTLLFEHDVTFDG